MYGPCIQNPQFDNMRSLALLSVALIVQSTLAVVLHTSGRWILNASNQRVKLRCVNWAGHMEVNIPEGLQHQPVATIAQWVASNGFNCVRLTCICFGFNFICRHVMFFDIRFN